METTDILIPPFKVICREIYARIFRRAPFEKDSHPRGKMPDPQNPAKIPREIVVCFIYWGQIIISQNKNNFKGPA
jgi:hypothetical protein